MPFSTLTPPAAPGQMQLCFLFPTAVQINEIPDAAAVNAALLNAVNDVRQTTPNSPPASWTSRLYTTMHSSLDLLARPDFAILKQHILTAAHRFADGLGLDARRFPLRVSESWINVYGTGDAQEIHDHANSVISGVYYVKAPPGSSPLTFHAPVSSPSPDWLYGASFEAVEGRMILFRSWLRHSVKPSKIRGERVSIAFNLMM